MTNTSRPTNTIKVYSYIRFSTPQQAKGDSLRRQMELSDRYCKEHGYTLDTTLRLHDLGVSGYKSDNLKKDGKLGIFLDLVKNGTIPKGSILLVESLDRLSRAEILKQLTLLTDLINNGITIVTLGDGNRVYSEQTINDNITNLMCSLIVMSRAHEESATKSKRNIAVWQNRREKGIKNNVCPAWLRFNKNNNSFEVIKEREMLINRMFQMSANGSGIFTITKTLNKEGHPTWGYSKEWGQSYVRRILYHRTVLGEYEPHNMVKGKRVSTGRVVENYFPQIVSKDLFNKVNGNKVRNTQLIGRKSETQSNLFAHIIKCGDCGSTMVHLRKSVKKGKVYSYLMCDRRRRGGKCNSRSISYNLIEPRILKCIDEVDWSLINDNKDSLSSLQSQIQEYEVELKNVEVKLKRYTDLIESSDNIPKTILSSISSLEDKHSILTDNLNSLREHQRLEKVKAFDFDLNVYHTLLSSLDDIPTRFKIHNLIISKVKRIELHTNGDWFSVEFHSGNMNLNIENLLKGLNASSQIAFNNLDDKTKTRLLAIKNEAQNPNTTPQRQKVLKAKYDALRSKALK